MALETLSANGQILYSIGASSQGNFWGRNMIEFPHCFDCFFNWEAGSLGSELNDVSLAELICSCPLSFPNSLAQSHQVFLQHSARSQEHWSSELSCPTAHCGCSVPDFLPQSLLGRRQSFGTGLTSSATRQTQTVTPPRRGDCDWSNTNLHPRNFSSHLRVLWSWLQLGTAELSPNSSEVLSYGSAGKSTEVKHRDSLGLGAERARRRKPRCRRWGESMGMPRGLSSSRAGALPDPLQAHSIFSLLGIKGSA